MYGALPLKLKRPTSDLKRSD